MKKLKIFSLLAAIMTALSLTACLPEKKPVSVYEQYSDVFLRDVSAYARQGP